MSFGHSAHCSSQLQVKLPVPQWTSHMPHISVCPSQPSQIARLAHPDTHRHTPIFTPLLVFTLPRSHFLAHPHFHTHAWRLLLLPIRTSLPASLLCSCTNARISPRPRLCCASIKSLDFSSPKSTSSPQPPHSQAALASGEPVGPGGPGVPRRPEGLGGARPRGAWQPHCRSSPMEQA